MLNPRQNYAMPAPRWMTLKQAKQYCPLGEVLLLRLLESGDIKGGKVAGDKRQTRFIDRESIDRYFDSMCDAGNVENEALAILEKSGIC